MKIRILFIIMLISIIPVLYSQNYTSLEQSAGEKNENEIIAEQGKNMQKFIMKYDFNNDGTKEIFRGILLKKINKNTFWIKNALIMDEGNDVIVNFGKKVIVNGQQLTEQTLSLNGYIVEILKDKILVSMADDKGKKNSDELSINIKEK